MRNYIRLTFAFIASFSDALKWMLLVWGFAYMVGWGLRAGFLGGNPWTPIVTTTNVNWKVTSDSK